MASLLIKLITLLSACAGNNFILNVSKHVRMFETYRLYEERSAIFGAPLHSKAPRGTGRVPPQPYSYHLILLAHDELLQNDHSNTNFHNTLNYSKTISEFRGTRVVLDSTKQEYKPDLF